MSIISRIVTISLSVILLAIILELVRRNKLKERYALLWLVTGFVILLLAVIPALLRIATQVFGIVLPINALFFFGIFFIILINLHFSVIISTLSEQNRKIVQKIALLEIKPDSLKDNHSIKQ